LEHLAIEIYHTKVEPQAIWVKFEGQNRKGLHLHAIPWVFLARPAGFEPATYGFVDKTSEFPNLLEFNRKLNSLSFLISHFSIFYTF